MKKTTFVSMILLVCAACSAFNDGPYPEPESSPNTDVSISGSNDSEEENPILPPAQAPVQPETPAEVPPEKPAESPAAERPPLQDEGSCTPIGRAALFSMARLKLDPQVFPGRSATLEWRVLDEDPGVHVEVSYQGRVFSTDREGSRKISSRFAGGAITLKVSRCGEEAAITQSFELAAWQASEAEGLSSVSVQAQTDGFWAGGFNGALYGSENGHEWVKISGPHKLGAPSGDNIPDASPVSSILDLGSSCDGALIWGSQGGYLYRSLDGGKTLKGINGGEHPLQYFTRSAQDPLSQPSPVRFVARDPSDEKAFYVGHSAGLVRYTDCTDPRAANAEFLRPHEDILDAVAFEGRLYVLVDGRLESTGDGSTWERHALPGKVLWMNLAGNFLAVGTEHVMHALIDGTWRRITGIEAADGLYLPEGQVVAAVKGGVEYRPSKDPSFIPGLSAEVSDLGFEGGRLWALTQEGEFYLMEY